MPGIWTSLTSHPSISRPIDRVFRIGFVLSRCPEITALLTAFPRATMLILIMGITQTKTLVLDLTPPAASKRQKRRIATYPLLTTRCLHQWRRGIATETTMLAGNRIGFHTVVCHRIACSGGMGCRRHLSRSLQRGITQPIALSSAIIFLSTPEAPYGLRPWGVASVHEESTLQSQTQSKSMETQRTGCEFCQSFEPLEVVGEN